MLQVHPIFQTPVFVLEFTGLTDATGLEPYIRELCTTTPGTFGRDEVVQSRYDLNRDIRLRPLCEALFGAAGAISREVYRYSDELVVEISSMWGNQQRPGCAFERHVHYNNMLSGVFYLNEHPDFPPITFHRPPETTMDPLKTQHNVFNQGTWSTPVKKDTAVIFPAWLPHSVGINHADQDRLGISFNIMLRGPYYNNVL